MKRTKERYALSCPHAEAHSYNGWKICADCGKALEHPEPTEGEIVGAIQASWESPLRVGDTFRMRLARPFVPMRMLLPPHLMQLGDISQPVLITPELHAKAYGKP